MADFTLSCPIPISDYPAVLLTHGGGGRLMHQLIDRMFRLAFDNPLLAQGHDGVVFPVAGGRIAFTGEVVASGPGLVTVKTPIEGSRILDMLSGEQLPRIC